MEVVSQAEWTQALQDIRAEEKQATSAADALAAKRRRLPAVAFDTPYRFQGPDGEVSLLDMFEGRPQLILYHFMFAPGVSGWPEAGCDGCSMFVDQIGHPAHFHARDTSLALVSLAPIERLEAYRKRMGWTIPWYSSAESTFNRDLGRTRDDGEYFGLSVFIAEGDRVLRTYFTDARGVEALGTVWSFLDRTPLGRQETWEDSPPDQPQGEPYTWWRRHDEYERN
jgi:predicted dithiol-disulfide oxidoreductase (DUF899 family)